jgi:hypothetical protein
MVASCGGGGDQLADESDRPSSMIGEARTVTSEVPDADGGATDTTSAGDGNSSDDTGTGEGADQAPASDAEDVTSDTSDTTVAPDPSGQDDGGGPLTGAGPIDSGLQPFIDSAVAQLVGEHGYAPGDITVESARLVQWGTAAAGCPQPRMQYAQVVTDGSAIELVAGGETYWFHTGSSDGLVLCTSPLREAVPEADG